MSRSATNDCLRSPVASGLVIAAAAGLGVLGLPSCSVAHLSYSEVQRDLDSIVVVVDAPGTDPQLVYEDEVEQAPWYARSVLLWPMKPMLLWMFGSEVPVTLENPSGHVRELIGELAPKAGDDLSRAAMSAQRLVRIAELDPSALNRIVAITGLGTLARAQGFDLTDGLEQGDERMLSDPGFDGWVETFSALRPAARTAGEGLSADQSGRYVAVLSQLTSRPLSLWQRRLALLSDLSDAYRQEVDTDLRSVTYESLERALLYAIQSTVVSAMRGQDPEWVDVRLAALDLLHRSGGVDSVPLLLALMSSSADRIGAGDPQFDPDWFVQLRLIHFCGQLNKERGSRSVLLPGFQDWQRVSPLDFLARIVLDESAFLSPLALPAREALARSLGRPRLQLDDDQGEDWVRAWYDEYRRQS